MAKEQNDQLRESVTSLADLIKKQKASTRDDDLINDIEELESFIQSTTEKRRKNTVSGKFKKEMGEKLDRASNPTTYLRAVVPKMFKTFHENMDLYDQERMASKKLEQQQRTKREEEISKLKGDLKTLIDSDTELTKIFKDYGEKAAMEAALLREEHKSIKAAEAKFFKDMEGIDERLKNLNADAQQEWAKRKGIQLVKIVDTDPTVEELQKIKAEISEQIESDAKKYDAERKQKVKDAKERTREKEALLEDRRWWKKIFGKNNNVKTPEGGGFIDALLAGGVAGLLGSILPFIIKAGLIAGLAAAFEKYINDEEFRGKVNEVVGKILGTIWKFMKEHWEAVLAAFAVMFPVTTIRLIGKALNLLYEAIWFIIEQLLAGKAAKLKGKWGKLGKIASVGAMLSMQDNISKDSTASDMNLKMLEDSPFYNKLTEEEIKQHKKLVDEKDYTGAESYRQILADKYGFRPTSAWERATSGDVLNPKLWAEKSTPELKQLTDAVDTSKDIPEAIPVEVSMFGEESIQQLSSMMLAYRKFVMATGGNKSAPPVVVNKGDGKSSSGAPVTTSARDTTGQNKQIGDKPREGYETEIIVLDPQ